MTDAILRQFEPADALWLTRVHGDLYARDEGFDASFEVLVGEVLAEFIASSDPACERGVIAERAGTRLGSIFCVRSGVPGVAKLRLFLVLPEARGHGLGQQLLNACLDFARGAGYRRIRLATHESHRAACALYAANGFACTGAKPVRSFGLDLVEQYWQRDL